MAHCYLELSDELVVGRGILNLVQSICCFIHLVAQRDHKVRGALRVSSPVNFTVYSECSVGQSAPREKSECWPSTLMLLCCWGVFGGVRLSLTWAFLSFVSRLRISVSSPCRRIICIHEAVG